MHDLQPNETSVPLEDQLAFQGAEILGYESLESTNLHIAGNFSLRGRFYPGKSMNFKISN
jgi:hypothetical protein